MTITGPAIDRFAKRHPFSMKEKLYKKVFCENRDFDRIVSNEERVQQLIKEVVDDMKNGRVQKTVIEVL